MEKPCFKCGSLTTNKPRMCETCQLAGTNRNTRAKLGRVVRWYPDTFMEQNPFANFDAKLVEENAAKQAIRRETVAIRQLAGRHGTSAK